MKQLLTGFAFVLVASSAFAQQPIAGTEQLEWTHDGVNASRFEVAVDNLPAVPITTLRTGTTYTGPLPAMTPGVHQVSIYACSLAGCSGPAVVSVLMTVIPAPVTNVRIVRVPSGGGE